MINIAFIAIAIAGTAIGAYTDIRTRLVPDWTSYFMLAAGLGGHAILSLLLQSIWPIIYSAAGAGLFFAIGYLLYRIGVWGGGDAKLLPALGSLLAFSTSIAIWPFLVSFWLNLLILGAAFGILGMLILFIKHRTKTICELKSLIKKFRLPFYATLFAGVLFGISATFIKTAVFGFVLAILGLLLFVLKATEKAALHKLISPHKLVEGDWLLDEIKVGNYCYKPKKIGIEKSDIAKLIEFEKLGKLKEVKVKDGIPYVPAFLAALIITILGFDIFFWILTNLMV
jgi:Flp pilus assembly protein protease CpaA